MPEHVETPFCDVQGVRAGPAGEEDGSYVDVTHGRRVAKEVSRAEVVGLREGGRITDETVSYPL